MANHKRLVIGLFGFGVVGEALYRVLLNTNSLNAGIKKVCIKQSGKKRNAPAELFTTNKQELLNDDEINVIVELIDDQNAAFEIVKTAFVNGKSVVSANKRMIAEHLEELLRLQKEYKVSFLYEAAACASIPVIRNLEEYYDNDLLQGIKGIINGSTNFILTKMTGGKLSRKEALLLAQQLGFAESSPTLDVTGQDAVNKWVILLNHAFGLIHLPNDLLFHGIQNIDLADVAVADEKKYSLKLVAEAKKLSNGKIAAFVSPRFLDLSDPLASVKDEFNGVVIESSFADQQFFYGKGAGGLATASAVLSDISALRYEYRYEYKKHYHQHAMELTDDFYVNVYVAFSKITDVQKEEFESIEEWHVGYFKSYFTGIIHYKKLLESNWWKQRDISLILLPDPVIEDVALRKIKRKSLELAGIAV